ncbi:DUF6141 family protein [candidate division KSB1 bacterium]
MKTSEFNESQRFNPFWIWILLILILGIWIWGVIQQLFLGIPFGTHPTSDIVLLVIGVIPVGFLILLIITKLQTFVKKDGIYLRYFPFHMKQKRIQQSEIKRYAVTEYHPMKDYGGWGIRFALGKKKGKAYNVKGNIGMQLELNNGKNILIGTQRPDAFKKAIDTMKKEGV